MTSLAQLLRLVAPTLLGLALATGVAAQDVPVLLPDASSFPDTNEKEPGPSPPEIYSLPSWKNDDPKLVPRLWPGSPGSATNPTKKPIFEPEIQLPPEVDPTVIPEIYLADYFGSIPETQLVDPQTLLTAHERTSINNSLQDHLNIQRVPIYILLFQKEQRIPEFQNLEALQTKWFGDQPGVVIAFWLGSPTRTSATFGHSLRGNYGTQLDNVFADALGQSYTKTYPFSQLDHFTYTLLWRLSRLEDGLEVGDQPPTPGGAPLEVPDFSDEAEESWVPIATAGSALALGVAALGAGVIASLRKRERKQKEVIPITFPTTPAAERLGGPHSGGSGAVIKAIDPPTEIPS